MRITLSGAMRARDVSRPTEEQLAAAAEREARTAHAGRSGGASTSRGAGGGSSVAAEGPGSALGGHVTPTAAERTGRPVSGRDGEKAPTPVGDGERAADEVASTRRRRRRRGR